MKCPLSAGDEQGVAWFHESGGATPHSIELHLRENGAADGGIHRTFANEASSSRLSSEHRDQRRRQTRRSLISARINGRTIMSSSVRKPAHAGGEKGISQRVQNSRHRGLTWKDLRATFGTRLAEAGCDAFTIAQLLGHSDVRVMMRYLRAVETSKRVQLRQ